MEQRSEWRIFYIIFFVCCLVHHSSTDDLLFALDFQRCCLVVHLSNITLNLLSPQFSFFMVLKCDLFVYHGNKLTSSRVIMRNKHALKCFVTLQKRILQSLGNYHDSILTTTMSWKLPHRKSGA